MQRAGLGIEVRRGPGMITVLPDSGLAVDQIVAGGATRREAWIPPRPMNAAEKSLYAHLRGRGTDIAESNDTAMDIDAPPAASGTLRRIQMLLRPWHKETANSRTPS